MKHGILIGLIIVMLSGCSALITSPEKKAVSSSLVSFLYPDEDKPVKSLGIPKLSLPVNVGITFLPSYSYQNDMTTAQEMALLEKVKASFDQYDYIGRIELIPSVYLRQKKGFDSLRQVAQLHDVELMALVSYDQLQQTREGKAGLLYWTIVGLYTVPANKNSVETFVDTAVFDVKTETLLFRAPGVDSRGERSTAVKASQIMQQNSREGFDAAMSDMVVNLNAELSRFKQRVKEEKIAQVERREGYSGGSYSWLLLLLSLAVATRRMTYRT